MFSAFKSSSSDDLNGGCSGGSILLSPVFFSPLLLFSVVLFPFFLSISLSLFLFRSFYFTSRSTVEYFPRFPFHPLHPTTRLALLPEEKYAAGPEGKVSWSRSGSRPASSARNCGTPTDSSPKRTEDETLGTLQHMAPMAVCTGGAPAVAAAKSRLRCSR